MSKLKKFIYNPNLFFRDALTNIERKNEQITIMVGFSKWKRDFYSKIIDGNVVFSEKCWKEKDFLRVFLNKKKIRCIAWGYNEPLFLSDILRRYNVNLERLEDGFLRSVGLGAQKTLPYSYIIDKSGTLYFDSRKKSDLEDILSSFDFEKNHEIIKRAENIINKIIRARVSKYNSFNGGVDHIFEASTKKKILIVGQVEDDASIKYGCDALYSNGDLVELALLENPDELIYFKPHPDVLSGARKEYTSLKQLENKVNVIYDHVSLNDCLDKVDHVYTITSLVGFEALLRDKLVTTVGCPFYSGWGLTDDRQANPRRKRKLTKYEVFAAAYILYPKYVNPYTGKNMEIEDVVDLLQQNKQCSDNNSIETYIKPRSKTKAWAFRFGSKEYRKEIANMLPEYDISFSNVTSNITVLPQNEAQRIKDEYVPGQKLTFLIWGYKEPSGVRDLASELGADIHRVEDGFIRSIGIGSTKSGGGLNLPWSIVLDKKSIYYNAHSESDIEYILNNYDFEKSSGLITRSREIIKDIRKHKITKYNKTFSSEIIKEYLDVDKKNILVIGQVQGDASLKYGCKTLISNNDLILCAAKENPRANILYKPHPATLNDKINNSDLAEISGICRIVDEEISLIDCFTGIDHVYTITSGSGFEALIHGISVTCLGANFYSGWGLTDDRFQITRRNRSLSLEEVFTGFYLIYTRYYDHSSSRHVELEDVIDIISREKERNSGIELYESAKAKFDAKYYLECEKLLIQALTLRNNSEWKFLLGRCYYEQQMFVEALDVFAELTGVYSGIFDWQYYKALTLKTLGKKKESLSSFRKALLLSDGKRYVKAEYIKVKSILKNININEAEDFESSITKDDKNSFQEAVSACIAFDCLGDFAKAKKWFLIASSKSISKLKRYPLLNLKYGEQKLNKSIVGKILPARYFIETETFHSMLENNANVLAFFDQSVRDYDSATREDVFKLSVSRFLINIAYSDVLFVNESSLYDCQIDVHNFFEMGYVKKIYYISDEWFETNSDNKSVVRNWLESKLFEQEVKVG